VPRSTREVLPWGMRALQSFLWPRHFVTSFHLCFPELVDILPLAGHNFSSAPLPRMAPITEEGE